MYGFVMNFKENTITNTCRVVVRALRGGRFRFPANVELVSAVFAISFTNNSKLSKPARLEIQHCVALKHRHQAKYLQFVRAEFNDTSQPPYRFRYIKGGEFDSESEYGSIESSEFSLFAIVQTDQPLEEDDPSSSSSSEDENTSDEDSSCQTKSGSGSGGDHSCHKDEESDPSGTDTDDTGI